MPDKRVFFGEFINLNVGNSIAFKLKLYLYTSRLIQNKSVLTFAIKSVDFYSKIKSSKILLNIEIEYNILRNRIHKFYDPLQG